MQPAEDPDTLYAHGLGVRYVPEPRPAPHPAPALRSDAARTLHRILDENTLPGCTGCWSLQDAWRSAEVWCEDAGGQYRRFQRTRAWLIAVGAVAVLELGVIILLSAVVLGWGV